VEIQLPDDTLQQCLRVLFLHQCTTFQQLHSKEITFTQSIIRVFLAHNRPSRREAVAVSLN